MQKPFNPFTPRVSYGDITVILTSESVNEILWCDHLNETTWAVLSHGTIYIQFIFGIRLAFWFKALLGVKGLSTTHFVKRDLLKKCVPFSHFSLSKAHLEKAPHLTVEPGKEVKGRLDIIPGLNFGNSWPELHKERLMYTSVNVENSTSFEPPRIIFHLA